jgi:LysR family glycine cleavage system transcriptional activator
MPALPSTTALCAFESAARSLSFQKAAQALHLTPGALSRQIQALERSLGTALFSRHHKRVELTEAGRQFLAEVAGPLEALAAAVGRARNRPGHQALSVFAYPTFAIRWLMPRWVRFHDRHPGVDLRLTTSVDEVDFSSDEYDVALAIAPRTRAPARLVAHDLLPIELFPVCAPRLAARLRRPADLARVTLLHGAPRPEDWRRWLEAAGVPAIEPRQEVRFDTLTLAYQAAIEGMGVAIGIAAFVEQDLAQGRLVRPFSVVRRSRQPLQLLYPASKAGDARVQAFREWVLQEARS